MFKAKSRGAVSKRIKKTPTGKLMVVQAGFCHRMIRKNTKLKKRRMNNATATNKRYLTVL